MVEIVRSDNGGEFFSGEFESACNELSIKQEFTPAYSSQCNSVAERGLGLIEEAANGGSYSGESSVWACAVT